MHLVLRRILVALLCASVFQVLHVDAAYSSGSKSHARRSLSHKNRRPHEFKNFGRGGLGSIIGDGEYLSLQSGHDASNGATEGKSLASARFGKCFETTVSQKLSLYSSYFRVFLLRAAARPLLAHLFSLGPEHRLPCFVHR